jgi:hypothetical protein
MVISQAGPMELVGSVFEPDIARFADEFAPIDPAMRAFLS